MNKKYTLLGVTAACMVISCTHSSKRDTASAPNYTYSDSLMCESDESATPNPQKIRWSALSGYSVGPTAGSQFKDMTEKIIRPFTSDGCSMALDSFPGTSHEPWISCCVVHDTQYWIGGTKEQKIRADEDLKACMQNKGGATQRLGRIYEVFVNRFGSGRSSTTFRWGYGWNYKRPYAALTPEETQQASKMYDVPASDLAMFLLSKTSNLVRQCDIFDVGLQDVSTEENAIYRYLNAHLKKDEVIQWAKSTWAGVNTKRIFVKFEGCENPLIFNFTKRSESKPDISGGCTEIF